MPRVRGRRHANTRIGAAVLLTAALVGCGGEEGPHNAPTSIVVADFNGDGTPDVVFSAALVSGKGNAASYPGLVSVLLNSHSSPGTFASGVHYTTGNNSTGMVAADLRGNGNLDLVVANYTAGTISVLLQDGTDTGKFEAADTITVGGAPHQVAVGDLNGDGKPDLVVADRTAGTGRVIILLQDPSNPGHFLPPRSLPVGNAVDSVAIADLNGDGKLDIAASNSDAGGNNGQVTVFYQNPASPGSFLTPVSFAAGAQPTAIHVVDLNGDGLPDIVVGNLGPGTDGFGLPGITVLLQNPKNIGSFVTPAPTYETVAGVIGLAVGDINKDGIPDVVTVNLGSPTGSVSIFLGDTTTRGVLDTGSTYGGLASISGAAIADLNGDGFPDIALADGLGASVLYQISTTPGTFNAAVQICTVC